MIPVSRIVFSISASENIASSVALPPDSPGSKPSSAVSSSVLQLISALLVTVSPAVRDDPAIPLTVNVTVSLINRSNPVWLTVLPTSVKPGTGAPVLSVADTIEALLIPAGSSSVKVIS